MKYGTAISKLRVNRMKQTQNEFADGVGITQTYLSQLENNIHKPTRKLMEAISDYTNTPMAVWLWASLTPENIPEHKVEAFRIIKPSMDALIQEFFPN